MQDGRVACWGNNDYGQLGDGTLVDKNSPVYAQLPNSKSAVMIDVGISHTCAVMDDGTDMSFKLPIGRWNKHCNRI